MWNSGATASTTVSQFRPFQMCEAASEAITVWWVCMQPFGWPVVPEV